MKTPPKMNIILRLSACKTCITSEATDQQKHLSLTNFRATKISVGSIINTCTAYDSYYDAY